MKVQATVTIELEVDDLDEVSDAIHDTWTSGDPDDEHNACITVDEIKEVDLFSWEKHSRKDPPAVRADG